MLSTENINILTRLFPAFEEECNRVAKIICNVDLYADEWPDYHEADKCYNWSITTKNKVFPMVTGTGFGTYYTTFPFKYLRMSDDELDKLIKKL